MNAGILKAGYLKVTVLVTHFWNWKKRLLVFSIPLLAIPVLHGDFSAIPEPEVFMADISRQPAFDAPLQKYYAAMVMQSLISSINLGANTGSIDTTTTRFQKIFLRQQNGPEQRLEFVDFSVPCREGHHLAVIRLGRGGQYGWDCVYHNYDTDMAYYRTKLMEEVVLPKVGKLIPTLWMLAGACFSVPFAVSWNANPLGMIVAALAFGIGTLFIASLITNLILGNRAESRMPEVYQAIAREIESHRGSV